MALQELTAGHGVLTAVRQGEGRDLVVLHSLLTDRHAFDPVLPVLSAKFRVTLINLPGFHGSQPTPLALMDAYVAAIEDGFQEFDIANDAILLGNGFGGTLALAFAIAHPERISKLVLSDAAGAQQGHCGKSRWRALCRDAGLRPLSAARTAGAVSGCD
jgi:3-oxoadipate enol-lactonase